MEPTSVTIEPSRQALARPLTAAEEALADALLSIFASGEHDFAGVAERLNTSGVARPSRADGAWSLSVLEAELSAINRSLDDAYAAAGHLRVNTGWMAAGDADDRFQTYLSDVRS
jgi:hypothetical protein